MRIHKEGPPFIIGTLVLVAAVLGVVYPITWGSGGVWVAHGLALGGAVLIYLVVNFFRNPARTLALDDTILLAPADGKLVVIEKTRDPRFLDEDVWQFSIFMSPLNVHVNRNPVSGTVQKVDYFPGKYLVAWHPKSSTENEQTLVHYHTARGPIGIKQIAGAVARRIKWYIQADEAVQQGREMGFIRFGSRVDVLVPASEPFEVLVELGQPIRGGETALLRFG